MIWTSQMKIAEGQKPWKLATGKFLKFNIFTSVLWGLNQKSEWTKIQFQSLEHDYQDSRFDIFTSEA